VSVVLGRGVYTFKEAARYTTLKESRVREWFRHRPDVGRDAVFVSDYEPVEGDHAVSFYDLIDVYVAGHLRDHGVSLQTIRKVYAKLAEDFGTPHPFCHHEILDDGKKIFVRGLDKSGQEEIMEALTKQKVFPRILKAFLNSIDYDAVLAKRWRIGEAFGTPVVIDPQICFGTPIVEAVSKPTYILAAAYRANSDDAESVAKWYGITPEDVMAAVNFEAQFAA
jgi:uncharacterized protein (DUF433 family)